MSDELRFGELREANVARCEKHYHPVADWSLTDWMCAVTGEAGELAGVIKNIRRRQTERTANGHTIASGEASQLADEAADVVIYLDLLCARAGIDLGAAVRAKFNRVSRERLMSSIVLTRRACICGPSQPSSAPDGGPWPHASSCPMFDAAVDGPRQASLRGGA